MKAKAAGIHKGYRVALEGTKDGRTTLAQYMGGTRWRISVKKAS